MSDDTIINHDLLSNTAAAAPETATVVETPSTAPQIAGSDLRAFIDDKGNLTKGWAKAFGAPESFEGKYSSLGAAFGAHHSLVQMLGRDKVPVPTDNSDEKEWDAFYARIGRPDKPEGYAIQKPEELPPEAWDENRTNGFQAIAHQIGLTPKQAQALAAWEIDYVGKQVAGAAQKSEADKRTAVETLKQDWGADYDDKLHLARHAAESVGGVDLVNDAALANNPAFIRVMARVGEMITESRGLPGARTTGASFGGNAKSEIDRIYGDATDPYHHPDHPQHTTRRAHVEGLFRKAFPGEG